MTTDPSWLYSTIAQCSAAIVAIIGGFMTATVLRLTSEKKGLKNQLDDKKAQLDRLVEHGDPMKVIKTTKGEKIEIPTKPVSPQAKEVEALRTEVSNLETRLKALSYPPNLELGLAVLGYLTVFGIWLPVVVIAFEHFSVYAKIFAVSTFLLGIFGVFEYVLFQIRELRRR